MFFFFKQKTAYEMRISDWSSDVCSSDLSTTASTRERYEAACGRPLRWFATVTGIVAAIMVASNTAVSGWGFVVFTFSSISWVVAGWLKIGRAACRERVCQYV